LSFAVQTLEDEARLEDEGSLFEDEEESLPELEEEALPEDEETLFDEEEALLEDDNSPLKELLLILETEPELEAPACPPEDEPSSELELSILAVLYASRSKVHENV